jgi:exopolysaccharide biosynthesis polyprenyl glycosylphosphotransferase
MDILLVFLIGFMLFGFTTKFFINIVINLINRKSTVFRLVAESGNQNNYIFHQMGNNGKDQVMGSIKWKEEGDKEEAVVEEEKLSGKISDINQYLQENRIDEIVISIPLEPSRQVKRILDIADYHGVRVKYVLDFKETFGRNCKLIKYGKGEALNVRQLPLDEPYASFLKNSFDFVFSSIVLLGLIPIFIFLGILIKIDSPGTIFYCPTRIGRGGKPIKIFKFRTMIKNDHATGGIYSTQKDDPRISKFGKILRKYSLDELPQFINVFLGEMSVVGPRPHRSFLNQQFQASEANYMIRHYHKPGITGWAQVNGWRGPTDTYEQKHQRTLHDLWYLENWSLKLDLKIIYLTVIGKKTHKDTF